MSDAQLRRAIRGRLPERLSRRRPSRLLLLFPMIAGVVAGSVIIASSSLSWILATLISLLIGNLYAMLVFFGHDVGHGTVVRSRTLQDLVLSVTGLIFCVPASLWRHWHNVAHHAHPNDPDLDPDSFGLLDAQGRSRKSRWLLVFAPGSRRLLGIAALCVMFTVHAQVVLWFRRTTCRVEGISLWRSGLLSAFGAAFWISLGVAVGPRAALFVIIVPMATANAITMSYIVTNHMISPLEHGCNTLTTTMSVTTWRVVDWMHFNFSHHVEHHLFPGTNSAMYPRVRRAIREIAPDDYVAPSHLRALWAVLSTPRLYADIFHLCETYAGQSIDTRTLRAELTQR